MAKDKKGRKRQGLFSKAINIFGFVIGLARPIQIFVETGFTSASVQRMIRGLTFGFSDGEFALDAGLKMYTPVGGAIGYRELTKYLMRHFPVR